MTRVKGMVSVISINMNQMYMTAEFLESLKDSTYTNIEVIIVDQNSDEDPEKSFKQTYPDVILVKSKVNLGFTGGNNLAVEHSKGEYIFCVNNDTIIPPDLIGKLIQPFSEHKNIGIVSPKIIFYNDQSKIQYAGYTPVNNITGRNDAIGNKQHPDIPEFNQQYETEYAHGCAMMIPHSIINDIGFLTENFFIYYEELDFSQRVKNIGYKIWYNGTAHILHKESVTTGKNSTFKEYYHTKNRILFMRRHSKTYTTVFLHWIYFLTLVVSKKLITYTLQRKFTHLKEFFRAVIWNFKNSSDRKKIKIMKKL